MCPCQNVDRSQREAAVPARRSGEEFAATLAALNVQLPVKLDDQFFGSISDAAGREVLVVDHNNERPDGEAIGIAFMVAVALNASGGFPAPAETQKAAEPEGPAAAESECCRNALSE
jgi:hypothetical protein